MKDFSMSPSLDEAALSLEERTVLSLKFDENGLIPVVVQDVETYDVLMLAYMSAESLEKTLQTGQAWYFSRSRKRLWRKGETSGNVQSVVEARVDCDQDAVLLRVRQTGPACHTNRQSCFYRRIVVQGETLQLAFFMS